MTAAATYANATAKAATIKTSSSSKSITPSPTVASQTGRAPVDPSPTNPTRFLVGIDLGTTNSALAYIDRQTVWRGQRLRVEMFPIPQAVEVGEWAERLLLPSFLYLAAAGELPSQSFQLPWLPKQASLPGQGETDKNPLSGLDRLLKLQQGLGLFLVGEAARRQSQRVAGRGVASAKSWLCHPGVDRQAEILPWDADDDIPHLSPVLASACYLDHLRQAWNHHWAKGDQSLALEEQQVVLTVPASFDDVARELTVQAAQWAGLKQVTLLEEPLAAFYHWLHESNRVHSLSQSVTNAVGPNSGGKEYPLAVPGICLVIDCGGGTTDFSLIGLREQAGTVHYERLAVGEHLLLGGDNMDLTLARLLERRLAAERRLDAAQWNHLVQRCRQIKEEMLGEQPPATASVTVQARSRRIVAGTLHAEVSRDEVQTASLDGFFPVIPFTEPVQTATAAGLQEFGLPYVADVAITRHLAQFLREHQATMRQALGQATASDNPLESATAKEIANETSLASSPAIAAETGPGLEPAVAPTSILFNGGVFNAAACRQRVLAVMQSWFGSDWQPDVLATDSLDLAVARGAACFSWVQATGGKRIQSGTARSYYIQVATPSGTPALLCLLPQRSPEGEIVELREPPLEVQIGQPIHFPLFTSTVRPRDGAGHLFPFQPGQMAELPGLTTLLRGGKRAKPRSAAVHLEARLTAIGTIELYCVETGTNNRWKLQFQTRPTPVTGAIEAGRGEIIAANLTPEPLTGARRSYLPPRAAFDETWSGTELDQATEVLRSAFAAKPSANEPSPLAKVMRTLEEVVGQDRWQWPIALLRGLWEPILELAPARLEDDEKESRWFNLAGFCLRPGWGEPLDEYRLELFWKIVAQGVQHVKSESVWSEYWVAARRASGGLDMVRQRELGKRLLAYLPVGPTASRKPPHRTGMREWVEIWRAAVGLELLVNSTKHALGQALLDQLSYLPLPPYLFGGLARLGNRCLLHAPINHTLRPHLVEPWLQRLLEFPLADHAQQRERDFALVQISRRCGNRALEIDEELRERILAHLQLQQVPEDWLEAVKRFIPLAKAEQDRMAGDSLPPGLKLRQS